MTPELWNPIGLASAFIFGGLCSVFTDRFWKALTLFGLATIWAAAMYYGAKP